MQLGLRTALAEMAWHTLDNQRGSPDSLRTWNRQVQRDGDERPGPTSEAKARIKALARENCERRQANEILHKASAYFAQAPLTV